MRHKTGTFILTLAAAIALTAQSCIPALACGWESNDTGTYFWSDRNNTKCFAGEWQWIPFDSEGDAYCYYFDEDGYIVKNTEIDGWTVNGDGIWTQDGIPQVMTLSNTLFEGNYYENLEPTNIYLNSPFTVKVIDDSTISIQGIYWNDPIEAKKESFNVYRYYDHDGTYSRAYDEFIFSDADTVEYYLRSDYRIDQHGNWTDRWLNYTDVSIIFTGHDQYDQQIDEE